jgi:hypothetical protein
MEEILTPAVDVTSSLEDSLKEPSTPEAQHIVNLKMAFATAISTPAFIGDYKKVEKATQALTLASPEDRVRAQLKSHAEKSLRAKAALEAEQTGTYVAPTQAEFDAYVEEGVKSWRAKQPK